MVPITRTHVGVWIVVPHVHAVPIAHLHQPGTFPPLEPPVIFAIGRWIQPPEPGAATDTEE